MALEATHIRIALAVKDQMEITDLKRYVSGTIYPDSRNVTGIRRELTHCAFPGGTTDATTDFDKGWYIHLLVDEIQKRLHDQLFGSVLPNTSGTNDWIVYSALKIIQDMQDYADRETQLSIKQLEMFDNPSGEDAALLAEYYSFIKDFYHKSDNYTCSDYIEIWSGLNVTDDLVTQIIQQAESLHKDDSITQEIASVYDLTVEEIVSAVK